MEDFNFQSSDITEALKNRFVVFIGDSNQRNIYKDMVLLLQTNRYLTDKELRTKGVKSFLQDELIEGGCMETMTNGTRYREVRQYKTDVHLMRFYFVTRCYNAYMESILSDLQKQPLPDIVIINSCVWDITRYGPESIADYKVNMATLFRRFAACLPSSCLVIWNTTLPVSSSARSGFLTPEVEYKALNLRLDILEANFYAQLIASRHGFDVLDLHFYLRHQLDMRASDGIHWDMRAHRKVSNLLLNHIFEAWKITVPRKQITFGSYGSTHARNGYYQQLAMDTQQQTLPRGRQKWVQGRQQPLLLPSQQGPEDRQQPLPPQLMQQRTQERPSQPFLPQSIQLQPIQLQPIQQQPLQHTGFTAGTAMPIYSNNFEYENTTSQNVQGYDSFVWQPYQQSSSTGSDSDHSRTRYQPYKHKRHNRSGSRGYRNCR